MTLRLRTFGAVYLERDGTPLAGAHSQRRRLALLAYLAAANNAAITRDKLFALLWPESDDTSARHSLSQLLYALRHDLGPGAIAIDSETARLDPAYLASDVHEFDLALRDGRLEDAAALYLGAFLDGFHVDHAAGFNRWADEERSRRATECAGLLDRLAEQATSSGDQHRRVDWCRRRVALDAMDGRATLRLMEALAAIGDREGALRAARVYEALIRDELDSAADPAVLQLAERLRHPAAAAPTPPPNEARVVAAPPPAAVTVDQPRESAAAPRRWWPRVAATLGIAALVLLGVRQSSGRRPLNLASSPLGASVVLGDLEGPDSVLALAVREALRAELVNTRGVIVTSDLGMRELKSLMRLRPDSALSLDDLLALALRAGAHVAMAGSVLPIGNGAQIVVELVDPQTGASLRTFAERPRDGSEILAAVGRIGRAVGGAITQTSRDSSVQPLPVVTTASLPALKSYAQARHLAALGMRREAVAPAERAVTHDSLFALAHYFLGDVLWFIDQQTHAEAHLTKAYELLATLPPREQLVIRARYEQLVLDRPDSALAYWDLLHDESPGDALAYEGRAWALRALGRHEEAAASADTAMRLDPSAVAPNTNNMMYSLFAVGDTAAALEVAVRVAPRNPDAPREARFYAALFRGDTRRALLLADSASNALVRSWRRGQAHSVSGNLEAAERALDTLRLQDAAAYLPNALVNAGLARLAWRGDSAAARLYAREALDWVRRHDLSPPAVGRLAERIGDVAARAGDESTLRATLALVRERDRARGLRTYEMTLRTLAAAVAYARGEYADAARLAQRARHGVYFTRSLATIAQLEADARRASGDAAAADSLERLVATRQIVDGHFEAWVIVRAMAAQRAQRLAGR